MGRTCTGGQARTERRDMEDDLIELARICLEHARASQAPKVAAALLRMAKDYERRAAQLRERTRSAPRKWRSSSTGARSAAPARGPRRAGRDQTHRVAHCL